MSGWYAWYGVKDTGIFEQNGVYVDLQFFPVYSDSLTAFYSGQVDGICIAASDAVAPVNEGVDFKVVLVNDNSYGADGIVVQDGSLLQNTGISIYRITLGFVYAVLLGVPIGILVGTFKKAEAFIRPLCEFVRYMPVPAFVPLIMVWVGIEESAKITVIFIGTFFQLVLMVADDALAVPDDLINAGYTLGSNTPKTIFKILIPAMMPRLMETLRMMIGWAWTYLVSAELVAANTGLGYTILKSQRFLKTDAIFANIILIGLLGLITDRIFAFLNKKLFPWAAA